MNAAVTLLRQKRLVLLTAVAIACAPILTSEPALAQDSERQMESLLNKVEDSRGMQQGMQQLQNKLNQQQMQQQMPQGGFNQVGQGGYQNQYRGSNGFSNPQQRNSMFSQSPLRPQQPVKQTPFASLFGGAQQQAAPPPPRGPLTKRDLFRMFLEGDSSSGSSSSSSSSNDSQKQANNQRKYNSARAYRQTAEDAAMRALGAEQRSQYGNKSSRNSAADEAYYAASAARGAANSATGAAAGGALNANEAAASARNAADRAQASADRARANANRYHDE
jgi:hypothetical protein